jgi:hypothetical protein
LLYTNQSEGKSLKFSTRKEGDVTIFDLLEF